MLVYVLNHKGKPIMPCSPRKARLILKARKARVVRRTPFTIRWAVPTRSFVQPVTLGVDPGYVHVGLSAVTAKKEVYAADVQLREDIVKLNSERRMYRRTRRGRKTWYRQPRFLNRKKPTGWLAPSIQHKLDSHSKLIEKVKEVLPVSRIVVEVAAFDIQKIKNPGICGTGYQNGPQKDFFNVREYILYRDGHLCQYCKGESKDSKLHVHHVVSRQTGGDRPGNLITLCEKCHEKHHRGEIKLQVHISNGFKAETFMSMVRWKIVNHFRNLGNEVFHTFGYITKQGRISLNMPKSHVNDAFVISGGAWQARLVEQFMMRQVRKCNRKLFKGNRSHIRNTAPREVFGFRTWDKVLFEGKELFVKGRRVRGSFALSGISGYLVKEVTYKKLTLIERTGTLLIERRPVHLSAFTSGVAVPGEL